MDHDDDRSVGAEPEWLAAVRAVAPAEFRQFFCAERRISDPDQALSRCLAGVLRALPQTQVRDDAVDLLDRHAAGGYVATYEWRDVEAAAEDVIGHDWQFSAAWAVSWATAVSCSASARAVESVRRATCVVGWPSIAAAFSVGVA